MKAMMRMGTQYSLDIAPFAKRSIIDCIHIL